jgi:hypothetical protein
MNMSIVNNAHFQNSKVYQIYSFLCSLEFKELSVAILHARGISLVTSIIIFYSFETCKYIF